MNSLRVEGGGRVKAWVWVYKELKCGLGAMPIRLTNQSVYIPYLRDTFLILEYNVKKYIYCQLPSSSSYSRNSIYLCLEEK